MDALAQLQKAQNANKALTMAEKQQLKEFAKFSKALTSSMPSRMARGEETASSMNPDVLILDEASAALDAETEKRIQESLFKVNEGNRLTIAVAHRLATIRNADEIVSMVDGVIVERGTHESLISSDGLKVTNNFDWSLLIAAGALLVGKVCAKQIFPLSVSVTKLSQFLYFPVDLGDTA